MEADLRHVIPFGTHLAPYAQQRFQIMLVNDTVCRVYVDEIHACLGKHIAMLADDPLVIRVVVTEIRLCPIVRKAKGSLRNKIPHSVHAAL